MNKTHKLFGAFAAVVAVLALGGTLQAAVADSTRPGAAVAAREMARNAQPGVMVHRNAAGEPARGAAVAS